MGMREIDPESPLGYEVRKLNMLSEIVCEIKYREERYLRIFWRVSVGIIFIQAILQAMFLVHKWGIDPLTEQSNTLMALYFLSYLCSSYLLLRCFQMIHDRQWRKATGKLEEATCQYSQVEARVQRELRDEFY